MKTIILSLTAVLFAVAGISQEKTITNPFKKAQNPLYQKYLDLAPAKQQSIRKSEKVYLDSVLQRFTSNSSHDDSYYRYDKSLNKLVFNENLENDEKWIYTTFEYDNEGFLTRENYYYSSFGGDYYLSSSYVNQYADTLVSKRTSYSCQPNGDTSGVTEIHPYYSNGFIYRDSIFIGISEEDLSFTALSHYYHDQNMRIAQIDVVDEGNTYVSERELFEYNQDGNVTLNQYYTYNIDSSKLVMDGQEISIYNPDGTISQIASEYGSFKDRVDIHYLDGFLNSYDFFEADSLGNFIKLGYGEVKNQAYFPLENLVYDENNSYYFPKTSNPGAIREIDLFFRNSENDPYEKNSESFFYWSDIATSIKENAKPISVNVFPNPSPDYIQFDITSPKASFEIFTSEGKLKMAGTTTKNLKIDISGFPAGVYHYKLKLNGNEGTGSFVKL